MPSLHIQRWLGLGACALIILLNTAATRAHENQPLYLELRQLSVTEYKLSWRLPPAIYEVGAPHVELYESTSDTACLSANSETLLVPKPIGSRRYHCSEEISQADGQESLFNHLSLNVRWNSEASAISTLVRLRPLNAPPHSRFFEPAQHSLSLGFYNKGGDPSLLSYLHQGLLHIASGYDHLLFVTCLVLIAGSLRRVVISITGFTLAHSLTLGFAAFELLRVPIAAVETCIALSIAFLAAEIVRNERSTLSWRYPAATAMFFGLLHGVGFASALSEIGLPQNEKMTALLLFNIGVELGQLTFVAIMFPLLFVFRKYLFEPAKAFGTVIGCIAMFWTLQRLLG